MKPIPALRHSYANRILEALAENGPSTVSTLLASVDGGSLFKGNPAHPENRARSLLHYSRAIGLVGSENGTYALTPDGAEYVAAGEGADDPWTVQPAQAELLRALLLRNEHDDGIYEGAALSLSLL